MPRYKVTYAHVDEEQENTFGWGVAEIDTDVVPETDEQLLEIARSIGIKNSFTKVGILELTELADGESVQLEA